MTEPHSNRAEKVVSALVAMMGLTLLGGLTWGWLGGSHLEGGRGAGVVLVVWPFLGAAALLALVVGERLFGWRVRSPVKIGGVEDVGTLAILIFGLVMGAVFLGALGLAVFVWAT